MVQVRRGQDRGHANHGWLDSFHSFSFAEYYDPKFMGFRALRVINEDRIDGGSGFPTHPHRDMEIISYVIDGALRHKDTTGTESVIRPGDVQRMTAGSGIRHSEYNELPNQVTHFLQIWILPEKTGLKPGYEQKNFKDKLEKSSLVLVASNDGRDGSIRVNQDVALSVVKLSQGKSQLLQFAPGRHVWLQVIRGEAKVADALLKAGDGLAMSDENDLSIKATQDLECLIFDLA